MKKVIIISSSPRKDGNSETLAKEFMRGAMDAGNEVELITLRDYNLKYCTGCYTCAETGKCVINDGMNEIGQKLLEANVIVFATPVYFYSMSGQLKVMIDRLVPVYRKIKADIYMIATQYDSNKEIMDLTFDSIRGATKHCFSDCTEKGLLYGTELWDKKDASVRSDYLEQAYRMGRNV